MQGPFRIFRTEDDQALKVVFDGPGRAERRFTRDDQMWLRNRIMMGWRFGQQREMIIENPLPDRDPIMDKLQARREELGLERVDISTMLGMGSSETIRKYETGVTKPQLESLRAWCFLLGMQLDVVPR